MIFYNKLMRTISAYQRGHRSLPLPIQWEDITTKQKLCLRTSSKSVVTIIRGTQRIFLGNNFLEISLVIMMWLRLNIVIVR